MLGLALAAVCAGLVQVASAQDGDTRVSRARSLAIDLGDPAETPPISAGPRLGGRTGLTNPATQRWRAQNTDDPLAGFTRRPFERFIIPEGGGFLDPTRDTIHYGVDYANAEDYLKGQLTYFYPIGPGYVTARSWCVPCYVEGDAQGRVYSTAPRYNFGWGNLVLTETPYSAEVSVYVLYAHLGHDIVGLGDYVTTDDVIGMVGTTGYSQESHLHVEVRFGRPGLFWNADFTQWPTLDRWLALPVVNPAWLIFSESHPAFVTAVDEWLALRPPHEAIP